MKSGTRLEDGEQVKVGNRRGYVSRSEVVPGAGCSGGFVVLHHITFTEKFYRGFGKRGRWEPTKPAAPEAVNFAFITTL